MDKLVANYHSHTVRCGHALGSDEEYIKAALEQGITIMGFSDHIALPDIRMERIRMNYEVQESYIKDIKNLKVKYKDQIEIHLGYEAEWLPKYKEHYTNLLKNKKVEYLILGQHMYLNNFYQPEWYNSNYHDYKTLTRYVNDVIEGMNTGLFKYVAHPDFIMDGYQIWDEFAIKELTRLILEAKRLDIPLEVNCAGLRCSEDKNRKNIRGEPVVKKYPFPAFWDLVSKYDGKVVIGVDAHLPKDYLDGTIEEAIDFCKKHNLKVLEKLEF